MLSSSLGLLSLLLLSSSTLVAASGLDHSPSSFSRRQNNKNAKNTGNKAGTNLQTSLTLDPSQVQSNLANNGQNPPVAGQVPSLTSTNNFINFCSTTKLPITNGLQVIGGSCNPTIMGSIVAQAKAPSCKFSNPKNGDTIAADTTFTMTMNIRNLQTGSFTNAQKTYFGAPAQLNGQGILIGHSHVVIEKITALDSTTPADTTKFAFFKGLNEPAQNGVLSTNVTGGLPAGVYKMSSINSAANHQPALVGVAQHGSLDDVVYFTVTASGTANGGNNGGKTGGSKNNGGNKGVVNVPVATKSAATTTAKNPAATNAGSKNNGGNGGGKKGVATKAAVTTTAKKAAATNVGSKNNGGNGGGNKGGVVNVPVATKAAATNLAVATDAAATACLAPVTVTVTVGGAAAATNTPKAATTSTTNLQTFTGKLGGAAPAVVASNGQFVVFPTTTLKTAALALARSCQAQQSTCSTAAAKAGNKGTLTTTNCTAQRTACKKANKI